MRIRLRHVGQVKTIHALLCEMPMTLDQKLALGTLVIAIIGVIAGVAAVVVGWWTIKEAIKQARFNSVVAQAQFWILLRGVFANYDEVAARFRAGEIGPARMWSQAALQTWPRQNPIWGCLNTVMSSWRED